MQLLAHLVRIGIIDWRLKVFVGRVRPFVPEQIGLAGGESSVARFQCEPCGPCGNSAIRAREPARLSSYLTELTLDFAFALAFCRACLFFDMGKRAGVAQFISA
jgi:hypothetical protein